MLWLPVPSRVLHDARGRLRLSTDFHPISWEKPKELKPAVAARVCHTVNVYAHLYFKRYLSKCRRLKLRRNLDNTRRWRVKVGYVHLLYFVCYITKKMKPNKECLYLYCDIIYDIWTFNIYLYVSGIMFNTGIGQHILKNPLVVNGIIEKVGSADFDLFSVSFYFMPRRFCSKKVTAFCMCHYTGT